MRINTNLLTTSDAIRSFQDEGCRFIRCTSGSYNDYLDQIKNLGEDDFTQDYHVKTMFVFAPGTKLHDHELYLENKIVLQDKVCTTSFLANKVKKTIVLQYLPINITHGLLEKAICELRLPRILYLSYNAYVTSCVRLTALWCLLGATGIKLYDDKKSRRGVFITRFYIVLQLHHRIVLYLGSIRAKATLVALSEMNCNVFVSL